MKSSFRWHVRSRAKWTSLLQSSLPPISSDTQRQILQHVPCWRPYPLLAPSTRHSPKYRAAISLDGLAAALRLEPYPKRSTQESIRGRDRAARLRREANHHQGKSSLDGLGWILQPDAAFLHRRPQVVEWSGSAHDGAATSFKDRIPSARRDD